MLRRVLRSGAGIWRALWPVAVEGQGEPVARVAFYADDPRAAVRVLRERALSR